VQRVLRGLGVAAKRLTGGRRTRYRSRTRDGFGRTETRSMLKEFLRNWSPRSKPLTGSRQAGAMPYSVVDGQVVFLLVTSRHSGRWIFPKGALSEKLTPWESAAREALEEAGVTGEIAEVPIGSYRTTVSDEQHTLIEVDLYPLRVTEQRDSWDEMDERHRHWVSLSEAKRLLADRRMATLAETLSQQVLQQDQSR
jgi:8-oxo-dGTP pyrophosphatase MutT (NUDIX family)